MNQELVEFFEKLDTDSTLNLLATNSVLSLKNAYHYTYVSGVGSTAIYEYLFNYEYDKTLQNRYFENGSNPTGMNIIQTATGATALLPYHISAMFYRQILLGKSPIFNFSAVRNPYMRFYKQMIKVYIKDGVMAVIQQANHHLENKDAHVIPISQAINYSNINYDYLIRFENFQYDMQELFPNYENIIANPKRPDDYFDQFYSHSTLIEYVQETYKEDFEKFGYSLEITEHQEYDNSVIPRHADRFGNKFNNDYDLNILFGSSLSDLGYYPKYKVLGTALNFFLNTSVPFHIFEQLILRGYGLRYFEKHIVDFVNQYFKSKKV